MVLKTTDKNIILCACTVTQQAKNKACNDYHYIACNVLFCLQLNVAVKCLKAWNDQAFQQMQVEFIKEANAMSLLDHPHIIRLYGIVLSVPVMLVSFVDVHMIWYMYSVLLQRYTNQSLIPLFLLTEWKG